LVKEKIHQFVGVQVVTLKILKWNANNVIQLAKIVIYMDALRALAIE
jgi:hypothetical protein